MSHHTGTCMALFPDQRRALIPWIRLQQKSHAAREITAALRVLSQMGERRMMSPKHKNETTGKSVRIFVIS